MNQSPRRLFRGATLQSRIRHAGAALLLAVLATMVAAGPARAQSRWSADAVFGVAHVGGGSYGDRSRVGGGGRIDVRLATVGAAQVTLGASIGRYVGYQVQTIAPVYCADSTGQGVPCYSPQRPGAPNLLYTSAHVGVRYATGPFTTLEFEAGTGPLQVHGTRSGSRLGVSGGVNFFIGRPSGVGFVCGVQVLSWNDVGTRLYAYPLTIGLRFR